MVLAEALKAGISVFEFWDMTPREVAQAMSAFAWRQRERQRELAWLAWHVAALMRVKRLPRLSELLQREEKRSTGQGERERRQREHEDIVRRMTRG